MTLGERWTALTPRERKFLAAGAVAFFLFAVLIVMSLGGGRNADERVELTQAPPATAAPAPMVPSAPPLQPAFESPPPTLVPPAPTTGAGNLVLYGVIEGGPGGGAAILGPAGGAQRAVRVGRPIGGMVLKEIGHRHAILTGPSGDLRLELATAAPLSGN